MTDARLPLDLTSLTTFRVGEWHVDPSAHALYRDDTETRIEPKVMALLVALAARPGQTVSRDDLMTEVWPDVVVSEDALSRAMSKLRTALHDDAQDPRYVETIPKAGYRLLAPVEHDAPLEHAAVVPRAADAISRPEESGEARGRRSAVAVLVALAVGAVVLGVWAMRDAPPSLTLRTVTHLPGIERHPELAPDGQRLAFVAAPRQAEQDADLYVQEVGGAAPLRLTESPEEERHPVWLADGRIAFLRCEGLACGVFAVPGSGGGARRLLDATVGRWGLGASPDGTVLVAVARRAAEAPYRLVRLDIEGGSYEALTRPPEGSVGDLSPAVSPDGARVAFVRHGPGGEEEVVVQPLEAGAEPIALTRDNVPVAGLTWTEDGEALVYAATRGGVDALWRIDAGGGSPERVIANAGGTVGQPSIRGRRLVYESNTSEVNLYVAEEGGDWRPAVVSTGVDEQPALRPDGERIAFVSDRSGSPELWAADLDGSDLVRLTAFGGARLGAPRWSPDGQTIFFEIQIAGSGKLYRIGADGGTPQPMTEAGYDFGPRWGPDGRAVYFGSNRSGVPGVWRMAPDGSDVERVADGFVGEPTADGQSLLFVDLDHRGLWRRPLGGGDAVRVDSTLDLRDWGNWVVTDRGILLIDRTVGGARLVRVDPSTGARTVVREDLGFVPSRAPALAATPDARRVVVARIDRIESAIALAEPYGD